MEKTGESRLLQMQARFQQKRLQEREMKIASLYEAQQARALDRVRHSPSNVGNGTSPPQQVPAAHQPGKTEMKIALLYEAQQARALDRVRQTPGSVGSVRSSGSVSQHLAPTPQRGKVRQMFEERRTKAGIDKSYPLQPIHNTNKPATRKPLPNGYSKVTTGSKIIEKTNKTHTNSVTTHSVKNQHKMENIVNGSGDLNHNHELDLNTVKQKVHSNGETIHPITTDEVDRADNNYLLEDETFPEALAPTPTPRSPDPGVEVKKPPPRRTPVQRKSPPKTQPTPAATPPRRVISENSVSESNKPRGAMQRGAQPVLARKSPAPTSVSTGVRSPKTITSPSGSRLTGASAGAGSGSAGSGVPCTVCGRRFASDRLEKHQEICRKAHAKKRKPFDALKHRLAGTEAEPFISKLRKPASQNTSSTTAKAKTKPINNNWRQKHEEFIAAIRAAKQVQAHLNAGGKLSDLPPPPPSENPDYVSCPHCNRRFNQGAAERHIPKCANYQFNKPKPGPKRR